MRKTKIEDHRLVVYIPMYIMLHHMRTKKKEYDITVSHN